MLRLVADVGCDATFRAGSERSGMHGHGLNRDGALSEPVALGHFAHERFFGCGFRLVLVPKRLFETAEIGFRFPVEQNVAMVWPARP